MDEYGREDGRVILFYVSQYKNKYFYNQEVGELPEDVRKDVLVPLIFLTEEAGGVTELGFEKDGTVYIDSYCEEGDLGYDEVSARLLISEMEHEHADLIGQMERWYAALHTSEPKAAEAAEKPKTAEAAGPHHPKEEDDEDPGD